MTEPMSWFLSKKLKVEKVSCRAVVDRSTGEWDPVRTLQGLNLLLVIGFFGGIAFVWPYVRLYMEDFSARRTQAEVHYMRVVFVDEPRWFSDMPGVGEGISERVKEVLRDSEASIDLLGEVVEVLRDEAWVSGVDRVERLNNSVIRVYARYREPVALIAVGGVYRGVDMSGVLLPMVYDDGMLGRYHERTGFARPLLILEGVMEGGLPDVGMCLVDKLEGSGLEAGLELAKLLNHRLFSDQILSIDAGFRDTAGRVNLVLWTGLGRDLNVDPHVLWGQRPGSVHAVEPEPEYKLARMKALHGQKGHIDGDGKIVWLNRQRHIEIMPGFGHSAGLTHVEDASMSRGE